MKKITQLLMLTACLLFAGFSSAQQLVISNLDGCPGQTVPVTVSLEGIPNNLNSFDFTFDFTEEVTLSNIEPRSLNMFVTNFSWDAQDNNTIIFYGVIDSNTDCASDLGANFEVLTFDLLIPAGATECINTNTSEADILVSSNVTNPCFTQIIPMAVDEGKYCPDQVLCDPCCAAPNLYDEFTIQADISPTGSFVLITACLAPRNNCPNSQYVFEFFEVGPPNSSWSPISAVGNCTGTLQLPYAPGVEYIFRARYVNDICTTPWTEIDYVIDFPCGIADPVTIGGQITTMQADEDDCVNTQGAVIIGAEVVITQNGEIICESSTDQNGMYGCEVCPGSGSYEVCVTTTCDQPCDLKAHDLLRFRKIQLGIITPTLQDYILGDLNGDGIFSTLELICLQRYILELPVDPDDVCYVKNWCAFVPASDLDVPLAYPYDNCITIDADDPDAADTDFLRGMIGDLNMGCSDCIHDDGLGPVKIVVHDDGGGVISVKPTSPTRPNYLSLEIKLTQSNFQVTSVSGAYDNIQFNQEAEVLKIIATSDTPGPELGVNDNLLLINGQGAVAGTEDQLTLTDDEGANLLFDGVLGYYIESDTRAGGKRSVETNEVQMTLFAEANMLSFNSAKSLGNATIIINDVLGRQLQQIQAFITQGENTVKVTLPATSSGVFIVTLLDENGNLIRSQKIVNQLD